ncbi:archaeal proteasome endopeptidase complex subunit alpha [Natrialba asiatica]|uniref:Proteasome subunit alpha n=1 Tax=Natrialba asiatica (strain ATCC 700177 / DSM 12278 / JCM 9576 / FERM P-10747 / NBRC 102637 / 172P1) TaxID=29540 RepID=M0APQ3_NATA1|nr:archaeal proteasome endopeptidase complex subunit alpha [Natrialba asiatica]ELZ00312.1 proteasome subunit alpha [Natrialba asiatica DSM 12278]
MQGQAQQQAYDRGITIFSPDGRLYQVEYAREAVKRGTASIGVRTDDGVVLAVDKRVPSPLLEDSSVEKIHKADNHIGIASAGHVADARQLIDFARRQTQVNQLRYGEPIGVETLTKEVTDHIQQYTQVGGARPFGVALIVGGVENGEPRLFETDPSGTPYEWKALAVGADRSELQSYLEENYDDEADLDGGIHLALDALASVNDGSLLPSEVGLATIDAETERFEQFEQDRIADHLTENDLLDEGDEDGESEE